jgi:hypothetical protein
MSETTYASSLGTCYAKSADGSYRLYKVDGSWVIYLVSKEIFWNADYTFTTGKKLVATFGGYITSPESFDYGVDQLEEESRCLAAEFAAEFL